MKKVIAGFTTAMLVLTLAAPALALTQSEARNAWVQAQQTRKDANGAYRQAQLDYKNDQTPEQEQKLIDSSKTVMNDALDEAEAWLNWKKLEAQNDARVPSEIRNNITEDVATNLKKIEGFRSDVAGVKTRLQAAGVFLKLVGGYVELLTDVARNTGAMWGSIGDTLIATTEGYEAKLRTAAAGREDLVAKLDIVKSEIAVAKSKLAMAKAAYLLVKLPGTPLVKLSEGNVYLREAQRNLVQAQTRMRAVFNTLVTK